MNKKILSLVLAFSVLFSMSICASLVAHAENPKDVAPYSKGDPTGDGKIAMLDVTETQKYLADLTEFDEKQKYAADVTFDDDVTMLDITEIQRYLADLTTFDNPDTDTDTGSDNTSDSEYTLTVNGKKFKSGDTVNYTVALKCTSGDITAVDTFVEYNTSLLSFEYKEENKATVFPVISKEVVANVVDGEGFYFNSFNVNKDYSGFDFGTSNVLVRMSFTVPELTKSEETTISCKVTEMVRYDANGFTDLIIDGEILSDSVIMTDSVA